MFWFILAILSMTAVVASYIRWAQVSSRRKRNCLITTTTQLEEALATPTAFEEWLNTKYLPFWTIGKKENPAQTPIRKWLIECGLPPHTVVKPLDISTPLGRFDTPSWVRHFLWSGHRISRGNRITVRDAKRAMDRMRRIYPSLFQAP